MVQINISLSKSHEAKVKAAKKKGNPVVIRVSHQQLVNGGPHKIDLSPEQFKKVSSAIRSKNKRGVQLTLSNQQIGGLFPLLALAMPAIIAGSKAAALGAAGAAGAATVDAIVGKGHCMEGDGMRPLGSGMRPLGSGMRPLGSGIVPLGAKRGRGVGKKKTSRKKK